MVNLKNKSSSIEDNIRFETKHGNKDFKFSNDLVNLFQNVKKDKKKMLKKINQIEPIAKKLPKPIHNRAVRQVNFNEMTKDMAKYDSVVKNIRRADQLVFSGNDEKLQFGITNEKINNEKNKSSLNHMANEINSCLTGKNFEANERLLTETEMELLKSLSVEEAVNMHKNLQKRRVLLNYQEAKYRRNRQIKSKTFRKFVRKAKQKSTEAKLIGDEEETRNIHDRLRALERATLKHKNTGKWAKYNRIRSKFDVNSRNKLDEQEKIHQRIMRKQKSELSEQNNCNNVDKLDEKNQSKSIEINDSLKNYNPYNCGNWLLSEIPSKNENSNETESNLELLSKESLEKIISKRINKRIQMAEQEQINEMKRIDSEDKKVLDEHYLKDQNSSLNETDGKDDHQVKLKIMEQDLNTQATEIDDSCSDNENDLDLEFNKTKYFSEAFAGDDTIEEFAERDTNANKYNKELSNFIPGWNIWSGHDIVHDNKTKRKMVKKMQRKEKQKNAFIFKAIKKEPYEKILGKQKIIQFMDDFNSKQPEKIKIKNSEQPIGYTWCPARQCKSVCEPKIIAKMGTIIEPLDINTNTNV